MAAKTQITTKGLELLASSSKATGQHWWIGWYALAFVPDELQDETAEKLGPNMTKLTEEGDIIYNIFQGDMNGDGYQTTKASDKFKAVNYDSNIKKNYRYVLDEDGRNNLVTFVDGKNGLKGACVYPGVKVNESPDNNSIDYTKSKIPLPAPLLYTGVLAAGEGWSTNGMNIFLGTGNDRIENFYPVDKDSSDLTIPRVSADFRNYEGYKNGLTKLDDGEQAYADALTDITNEGVDFDGWFPSVNTYTQNDDPTMDYNQFCRQYWKVLSISNFNKYCAPVNASGLLYDENTGCRNMAKATKYFPISDYSVTSTAKTADNEYATGIKLKVQLKLNGNAEDGAYFKDVEMQDEENVATLNPEATAEEHQLFNTKQVSFKFNRIGIYAVPMRQYGCSDDSTEMKAQYQIDTEAEPVLFAVCEWDSPVTLSDSGEGLSEFQSDVFIDLSGAVEDSSVIRESAVFYNLYEDDAIDWYKNQLLANASMAEALVNMQIEMGYLRNQKNAKQGCCPKQEAIQQQKSSTGLRNLVDAKDYNSNSVRNRLAQEEGKSVEAQYSDIRPDAGSVGYPTTYGSGIEARKSTSGANNVYSAFYGTDVDGRYAVDYEDATFDEKVYINMVPSQTTYNGKATRFGKLWLRASLYYELYSFDEPTSTATSIAWDYPDEADTNEFGRITGYVTDYVGNGSLYSDLPYVVVVKTESGVTTTDKSTTPPTVIQGLPPEISSISWLATEINRDFDNYEIQREYKVYYNYNESTDTRDYDYKCVRTTKMSLPKIQLYKLDTTVFSNISKHLESTGWRIPTTEDWASIISDSEKEQEKIAEIRSATKWGVSGGTGDVYPLGGLYTAQGTIKPSVYTGTSPVIYLAIADDDLHVVKFDGKSFEIVGKGLPGESALSYVAILCVCDATKVSDGISKYKLGYDSYSLMEGSITEGNHNFNAGEKSVILASANYNSIFGGMYHKVKDSSHNAILNGYSNEISGAVFSTVFGSNNILERSYSWSYPACRMLVGSENTHIKGGATAAIFAEDSKVESAYQASIFADECDVKNIYCSRFIGQYSDVVGPIFSDVITYRTHHLPSLYMSRGIFTEDHVDTVPSSMDYAKDVKIHYSDLLGRHVHFWDKSGNESTQCQIDFSHLAAGDGDVGIVHTRVTYSDIFAYGDAKKYASFYNGKALDSLCINHSRISLHNSSIASDYVYNDVSSENFYNTNVNFCDISLGSCLVSLIEQSGTPHKFDFGVMKLSHSILTKCDASYVYESGTLHYLASSRMYYATLVGQMIALSSNYIRNTHIYGSLSLPSGASIANHIILGGLDGTTIGPNNSSASNYISEFGSFITSNSKNYPMIWSLGGIGLYMNKMILGNKGVSSGKAPSVGDVLSVVGTEDNVATVAWQSGSGIGGGGSGKCIITDFDVFADGVPSSLHSSVFTGLYNTIDSGRNLVLHNGATAFSTIVDDTAGPISGDGWSYDSEGSTWYNNFPWFRFKPNESVLDIYTWYAYKGMELDGTEYKSKWYVNTNWSSYFTILGNELREGVVYEVRIHVVSLPPSNEHAWGTGTQTPSIPFNDWASPISEKVTPGTPDSISLNAEMSLEILFSGSISGTCTSWGAPDGEGSSSPYIKPSFKRPAAVTDNNNCSTYSSRTSGRIFDTIAEASVQFVRLGNKVYIMSY